MFVVFHTADPRADMRLFKTLAGAKRSMTCSNRNAGQFVYNYLNEDVFNERYPRGKKIVKNLMTGKPVEIDTDTPWCCNPASETFWSM